MKIYFYVKYACGFYISFIHIHPNVEVTQMYISWEVNKQNGLILNLLPNLLLSEPTRGKSYWSYQSHWYRLLSSHSLYSPCFLIYICSNSFLTNSVCLNSFNEKKIKHTDFFESKKEKYQNQISFNCLLCRLQYHILLLDLPNFLKQQIHNNLLRM
jgi:hypothetical protein